MTPHPDDEALSALLDGEATAAEEAHAEACRECSGRLAQLRAVALAVGVAPEPVTAARRDAAIAEALAATPRTSAPVGDGSPALAAAPDASAPADDGPSPLAAVPEPATPVGDGSPALAAVPDAGPVGDGSAPPAAASGAGRPGRRRNRLQQWAAAAAVVAVLAGSVGVVSFMGGQAPQEEQATADRTAAELSDEMAAPGPGATEVLPVDGGDLGTLALAGVDDLARQIDQQLAPPDDRARRHDGAPSPATAESGATDSATDSGSLAAPAPCEAPARDRDPALGALLYTARATVNATPASVLGFQVPAAAAGEAATVRVLALSTDTCAELAAANA